jgi:hemerythrin-like domain-containing protein
MLGPAAPRRLRMIRPTDNLRADHVSIARGLDTLVALAAEVRGGGAFPAAECAMLLRFLREFVIGVHLHKEASLVCPALAMQGDEELAAAVGEVLRLHDEVVELGHSLVLFWEPVTDLSEEERAGFADTVDAVAARLRRLARIDEERLFPVCESAVPADDLIGWAEEFARVDAVRGSRQTWDQRLAPLVARWTR